MTKKRSIQVAAVTISASVLLSMSTLAQNEADALKFSQNEITGSARAVSMGGAVASLGGDVTGIAINPAGAAVLRNNLFTITPSFHTNIASSEYYSTTQLNSSSDFNIASFGIYGVKEIPRNGKWRSIAFGFGLNRSMTYFKEYTIKHDEVPSSIIDDYVRTLYDNDVQPEELDLDNNPRYPFDIALAWNNCLIDIPGGGCLLDSNQSGGYVSAVGELPVNQRLVVEESGSKRSNMFTFGANYDDKLYLGANVELSRIGYERSYVHSESMNPDDTLAVAEEHAFEYNESIDGLGFAASVGVIYRPVPMVRLGWSFQSPTVYGLEIEYESASTALFPEGIYETVSPYIGQYEFRLTSPLRTTLGGAIVLGKKGLISADAEYADFRLMRMNGISDNYSFEAEEDAIRTELRPVVNIRAGGEFRVTPQFSLRGGYAHYGNPYRNELNPGGFDLVSAGGGFQSEVFSVDLAYQYKTSLERMFLYDESLVDAATVDLVDHRFFLTFGYRF